MKHARAANREERHLPRRLTHGSGTHSLAARFLLKPGRRYEEAVKTFEPYDKTQEVNTEARKAGVALIKEGTTTAKRQTYIYVNNRLEGNALATIEAMVSADG